MVLTIKNLQVEVNEQIVLRGIDLTIGRGEVHAIMGPNGSGKSTLAAVLAGQEGYTITQGSIHFGELDLLPLSPEERASQGLFLAFQYPIEIPGVNNLYFLKTSVNSIRRSRGLKEYDAFDFMALVKQKMSLIGMEEKFLQRSLNEGFSGGEKKRNEILQMLLLEPVLSVLDETDSGLDIDSLQAVAQGINSLRSEHQSILLITHYQRLLHYVKPHKVHILLNGRIVKSGDHELALEVERNGYSWLSSQVTEVT